MTVDFVMDRLGVVYPGFSRAGRPGLPHLGASCHSSGSVFHQGSHSSGEGGDAVGEFAGMGTYTSTQKHIHLPLGGSSPSWLPAPSPSHHTLGLIPKHPAWQGSAMAGAGHAGPTLRLGGWGWPPPGAAHPSPFPFARPVGKSRLPQLIKFGHV